MSEGRRENGGQRVSRTSREPTISDIKLSRTGGQPEDTPVPDGDQICFMGHDDGTLMKHRTGVDPPYNDGPTTRPVSRSLPPYVPCPNPTLDLYRGLETHRSRTVEEGETRSTNLYVVFSGPYLDK